MWSYREPMRKIQKCRQYSEAGCRGHIDTWYFPAFRIRISTYPMRPYRSGSLLVIRNTDRYRYQVYRIYKPVYQFALFDIKLGKFSFQAIVILTFCSCKMVYNFVQGSERPGSEFGTEKT